MDNVSTAELAKTLAHPIRVDILIRMQEAGELSPVQYGKASRETLGNSSYHMTVLRKAGVIEVARTEPRRGTMEHFYALTGPRAPAILALLDFFDGL